MARVITRFSPGEEQALMSRLVQDHPCPVKTCPLSRAQARLWFLDQLQPGASLYTLAARRRWPGRLDVAALEHSLSELVRRHETLRTTFDTSQGRPIQVIAPPAPVPLSLVDLRHLAVSAREVEAERLVAREARHAFDLHAGPLLRATLVRLGELDHLLLVTTHAIVCDEPSLGLLFAELDALYRARSRGLPSPLADLPLSFAGWAERERRQDMASDLAYWRAQLAGAPAALALPTDRPRRPDVTAAAWHSFELGPQPSARLRQLAQAHRATPSMVLLASLAALLHRYTGQTDLLIGSLVPGRQHPELDRLIGPLANPLVLRMDVTGDPSFAELVDRVRAVVIDAHAHQRAPFELVRKELQAERAFAHGSPVQVMFAFHHGSPAMEPPGSARGFLVPVREPVAVLGAARLDLGVRVLERGACLRVVIEYAADLFDPDTIARLAGHFHGLVAGAAERPSTRVSELPLLTDAERAALAAQRPVLDPACARALGPARVPAAERAFSAELLPHIEAHVVDARGQLQPVGVPGELCVAGPGVGRGILGLPDTTALVPHPFRPGAALVRTGERARRLPGGGLELLGRIRDQLELLGMRIDPSEIEAVLEHHPAVREAAVCAHEALGETRLVAYVVPRGDAPLGWAELHRHCKDHLPVYMVPPAFATVRDIPRGPDGDIDRLALPRLDAGAIVCEQPFVRPRTPLEQVVARIIAEILDVEPIGIHDDFFELGGCSVMAMQTASRLSEALRIDVPLARLIANPTVASLCASLLANEPGRQRIERLAAIRVTVAGLSDDELEAMLDASG